MRYVLAILVCCASPAVAEEGEGTSLMQRGAELFFQGLQSELAPALDEFETLMQDMTPQLRALAQTMGPALADVLNQVEDWSQYQAPEILPNGDIIIRRKTDVAETDI
ncbi:MAG: hypothetical protein ACPGRD_03675 [Planktomarina sp.]